MKNIALTLGLLALTSGAALAQQTVRIGTEGGYPPYNFINENKEVAGFDRDVTDEACKRAQLTCTWVTNEWDSIIPGLTSGNYDAIAAGMSVTDERRQAIDFSETYTPPTVSAYAALSADADYQTGVVAAQVGTIQASHVATTGATMVEFASPDEAIGAVRKGEADAVFADKGFLAPAVSESNGELVFVGEDLPIDRGIGIGLRKSDTELKSKFDAAIVSMREDGTLNAMLTKWFGEKAGQF